MSASDQAAHLKVYNTPEIVARYAAMDSVSACEQALFDSYLRQGMAILDLGVGAGRTTPHLSAIASRYVGIDYSEEMIRACRSKFPHLQFNVADASDLSQFHDASFDAVVFSYNGIDCLPHEKRENFFFLMIRLPQRSTLFPYTTPSVAALPARGSRL